MQKIPTALKIQQAQWYHQKRLGESKNQRVAGYDQLSHSQQLQQRQLKNEKKKREREIKKKPIQNSPIVLCSTSHHKMSLASIKCGRTVFEER